MTSLANTLVLILILSINLTTSYSQEILDFKVKTEANNQERKSIIDLFRKEVESEINQKVIFAVTHLKVSANYAWFEGQAKTKSGGQLLLPDESYDCCHVEGLLKKVNGKWKIIELGLFSSDCWYCGLASRYPKVPKGIFTSGPLSE